MCAPYSELWIWNTPGVSRFFCFKAEAKRETKNSIKFTSKKFRKFELKIAMLRAYILRGKWYSHTFTSNAPEVYFKLAFLRSKSAPTPELSMPKRTGNALKTWVKAYQDFVSGIRTHIWCKPKLERSSKVQLCPWWKGRHAIPGGQNDLW